MKRPIDLVALRRVTGMTQVEVAAESGMYQPEISKLERRTTLDDVAVSTVRRYVEALGGELQLCAVVNGERFELRGAEEDAD